MILYGVLSNAKWLGSVTGQNTSSGTETKTLIPHTSITSCGDKNEALGKSLRKLPASNKKGNPRA